MTNNPNIKVAHYTNTQINMIKQKLYINISLLVFILICSNLGFAQSCDPLLTLESITNPGDYTVASLTESDGIRNGPDYSGATVYYPTNATGPFPSIVIVPGYTAAQSSIQSWGPFLASHGIVTMTIGTNSPFFDFPPDRRDALLDAMTTLRDENTRASSPLIGNIDTDKMAVGGWSMGGGGAQLAAVADPRIKAVMALCPWLGSGDNSNLNHAVPLLIFSAELDGTAPVASHANIHYDNTPATTDKLIFEIDNAGHSVANNPTGANGDVGKIGLAWLKHQLIGDDCYCPLFIDVPPTASKYNTTVVCPTPLPVELTRFAGYQAANQIYLNWETALEVNNQGFEIEYGNDGKTWEKIGFVNGEGTNTGFNQYEFIHKNPSTGENYYRLKQVDYDANYEYSEVINIALIGRKEFTLTPNPTFGIINIEGIQEGKIMILDTSGRVLKEQSMSDEEIDISDFPAGMYFIRIISDNQSFSKRIVKQ